MKVAEFANLEQAGEPVLKLGLSQPGQNPHGRRVAANEE